MRKEYESILNEYASRMYLAYTASIPEAKWGDRVMADEYLRKYYLTNHEYLREWESIQSLIFLPRAEGLPGVIFQSSLALMAMRGGCLFLQEDFEALRSCMISLGDKFMIIVQNDYNGLIEPDLLIRLKLPVNITWDEMMSGNYISAAVCEVSINEFFVFSESGLWGRYSASDFENPLDILGIEARYIPIFEKYFPQTLDEQNELYTWLPDSYRELVLFNKRVSSR